MCCTLLFSLREINLSSNLSEKTYKETLTESQVIITVIDKQKASAILERNYVTDFVPCWRYKTASESFNGFIGRMYCSWFDNESLVFYFFTLFFFRNQVERMLQEGVKLEIEAMATISLSFLAEVFLPSKINTRAYLWKVVNLLPYDNILTRMSCRICTCTK